MKKMVALLFCLFFGANTFASRAGEGGPGRH